MGVVWAGRWDYGLRPNSLFLPVLLLLCAIAILVHDPRYDLARPVNYGIGGLAVVLVAIELWARLRGAYDLRRRNKANAVRDA
jgi:hypothetical protein